MSVGIKSIGVVGKGGTGKTTVSAFIIKYPIARASGPILAVDADPNYCLYEALGVKVTSTIGDIRKSTRTADSSVPKADVLEYSLQEALIEEEHFDLLVMGRTEGTGCYCFVNNLLRGILEFPTFSIRLLMKQLPLILKGS